MLNKELLRFTFRDGEIHPRLLDVDSRMLRALAEELLATLHTAVGQSREEVDELVRPILSRHRSLIVAKGLFKLALDPCRFQEPGGDGEPWRRRVFEISAGLLREEGFGDYDLFRQRMGQALDLDPDQVATRLFSDLPARQPLREVPEWSPEALLHRYNLAQVQGLFFFARAMHLTLEESRVGVLRQLFKTLKFFRLMAAIHARPEGGHAIEVDGPLSLFQETRKYGLAMASFFPALLPLEKWRLSARVELPDHKPAQLNLDQSVPLVSHYGIAATFVPPEVALFKTALADADSPWRLDERIHLLALGGREVVTPDASFLHQGNTLVHLELFHPWHAHTLSRRLATLEKEKKIPLLVGVERKLSRDAELQQRLEHSSWFREHGFLFHQIPPVKRVLEGLDGFLAP